MRPHLSRLNYRISFKWFYPEYVGNYIRRIYFLNAVKQIPANSLSGAKILDVGCGAGHYAYHLARRLRSTSIKGIDLNVDHAKSNWPALPNLTFEVGDATKLQGGNYYDLIVCIDVIDDISNWRKALQSFHEALRQHGFLYIHFPKHPRPIEGLKSDKIMKYWRQDACYSVAECSVDDLRKELEDLGFRIVSVRTSFGRFGALAQEISLLFYLEANGLKRALRYVFTPFLKSLARLDLFLLNRSGNGLSLLCERV